MRASRRRGGLSSTRRLVTLLHPLDALMGWVNWTHPITMRVSQSERQIGLERASLETLLDIHEETGGVRAVDQAMVIGQ